jgi:rSAM/selenodomain-associated transferase 1
MTDNALIVVAREPLAGTTKTRLCPPFTPAQAADFYRRLLLDTLTLMARVPDVDCSVAYTPDSARSFFADRVPNDFRLVPQQGGDLGERLSNALAYHFELGYRRVAIMNSDGPTLPAAHLTAAFAGLDHADVTLGPGHDGGYYIIGMRRHHGALFEGIRWSTAHVLHETLSTGRRLVDVIDDLDRLRRDLARDPASAPQTWEFLQCWPAGDWTTDDTDGTDRTHVTVSQSRGS